MTIDLQYLLSPNQRTASFILPYLIPADVKRINAAFGREVVAARHVLLANVAFHNTLSLKQLTDWDFADLTSLCPLRIEIDDDGFLDETLQTLLQVETQSRFPNATSLRFSARSFHDSPTSLSFLQYCPRLKCLSLSGLRIGEPEQELEYFSYVPDLEELCLRGSALTRHLAAIVPKLPHLKRLDLHSSCGSLAALVTTTLEWLDISNGYRGKEEIFQYLPQTLKSLKAGDCAASMRLDDRDLEIIVEKAPYLEELEIPEHCFRSFAPLARLAQLRTLNSSHGSFIKGKEFQHLPSTLVKLDMSDVNIDNIDLRILVKATPWLEELDMRNSFGTTDFAPLCALPRLRKLALSVLHQEDYEMVGKITQIHSLELLGHSFYPLISGKLRALYPLQNLRSLIISRGLQEQERFLPEICAMFPHLSELQIGGKYYGTGSIERFRAEYNRSICRLF